MTDWQPLIDRAMDRTVADLQRLCRQPSVAAQGLGITETAALVTEMLRTMGARVAILDDCGGNPVIEAEFAPGPGGSNATLLYYDHYDVQPAEPLGEWTTPPWAAEIRDGKLFARGVTDNKGELVARLAAIRLLQEHGGLPCRVKFLIEGEEEIGSPSFPRVMDRHAARFAADACIWEFGDVDPKGRPQLYGGVKGMCYMQMWSRVAAVDLHSSNGVLLESAAWRLVQALATLKDPHGRIKIEGFYDSIIKPSAQSRVLADRIPFDSEGFKSRAAIARPLLTETLGQVPTQALCFEPTCTICGLESGYYGQGAKTVLPKAAQAKVDCRLVPGQDPHVIFRKVRRHLDNHGFGDIELQLVTAEHAYLTDPEHTFVALVQETACEAWGAEPVYHPSSAGTGPMYPLGHALKVPIVSTGCGWFGGRAHAPDESIRLADLEKGILHQILLLERFGER